MSLLMLVMLHSLSYAEEAAPVDPFVALDAAKMKLADGKLEDAREKLAQIPLGGAEAYIDEEVAFQRMLIDAAFLDATNFLYSELGRMKLQNGGYARWLWGQRDGYANSLAAEVRRYMQLTDDGYHLTFVRFRLPEVSEKHIQDVELYSDRMVLGAAAKNWDEGSEGLGKGLIAVQARVAVALSAASFYDMPKGGTVSVVAKRLSAGVPLYSAQTLDWIAETTHRLEDAGNGLNQLYKGADTRLAAMLVEHPNPQLVKRIEQRAAPPKVEAKPAAKKPTKKTAKKRKGKRR
ncbi:MAG: hypothetical protein M3R04_01655 [bacterium]|nr:hypothetical protein [bacterium]